MTMSVASIAREAARVPRRLLARLFRVGLYSRPLEFARDRVVLLFFGDFERDRLVRHDRHVRRALRVIARAWRGQAQKSGFFVAFELLVNSLQRAGYRVVVNDVTLARLNPSYPIGILGYPHVLEDLRLDNPAVLGPGLYDHPRLAPTLMDDRRHHAYIVSSEWMRESFATVYRDKCVRWHAAVDVNQWPAASGPKNYDFLVYVKFLWDRERNESETLAPVLAALDRRGLSYVVIRYGSYYHEQYRAVLQRVRGMIFLCEHETQGIAYQEAMASGVPVLAWDQGRWLDARYADQSGELVPASSVPYFSAACGEKFGRVEEFEPALDRFQQRLPLYQPRAYVEAALSTESSVRIYIDAYVQPLARPA